MNIVELVLEWARQCELVEKHTPLETLQELARTRRILAETIGT